MLSGGNEERRIGQGCAVLEQDRTIRFQAADRCTALQTGSSLEGYSQQRGVQSGARNANGIIGQGGRRLLRPSKKADFTRGVTTQRIKIDPQIADRLERPPTDKPAAKCVALRGGRFEDERSGSAARKRDGRSAARWSGPYDEWICSTHNRNGKARKTRARLIPASSKRGFHSWGR